MWKQRNFIIMSILIFVLVLTGCSSTKNEESKVAMDSAKSESSGKIALNSKELDNTKNDSDSVKIDLPTKKVIYQAQLHLRVKRFDRTISNLEEKAQSYGGYIAESTVAREGKEQITGSMTIRIPQKNFQSFLHDAEGQSAEVLSRNITGQDVTEEFVDLESRLKSKRTVEERLLSFMKNATKTEDLLKISADLAAVQEEIETIEGRMKFLENQTDFSTITITLYENKVVVPNLDDDQLNTWDKTKKQFMKSTNLLLVGMSDIVVFIFGNLPILAILIFIAVWVILYYKKKKRKQHE
ncbi:DUF4349 domain-containing protein [Neobacillus sp. LXY-1]|uniref:DUF4349 domain-containing protein n=1 Tax=Neobacillus sp. LXY-1 TaxID=3379133 RepID=UPI003EE307DE